MKPVRAGVNTEVTDLRVVTGLRARSSILSFLVPGGFSRSALPIKRITFESTAIDVYDIEAFSMHC